MNIRVAIVEDDQVVRENLSLLINATAGFSCVASCASGEEALERLGKAAPEVVLMDIHLPGQSGITCVGRLRALLPQVQVIMLTIEEDSEQVFESLDEKAVAKKCEAMEGLVKDQTILITGLGPIGLFAATICHARRLRVACSDVPGASRLSSPPVP